MVIGDGGLRLDLNEHWAFLTAKRWHVKAFRQIRSPFSRIWTILMNKFSFPLVKLVSLLLQGFIEVLFNYYTVIQYKYRYFCKEHGRFVFLKCQKCKLQDTRKKNLIDLI